MRKLFALALVGLMASTAYAGFTAGPFNGVDSDTTAACPGSGCNVNQAAGTTVNYVNGAGFVPGTFSVNGDLTEVNTGTFANEARFRVTSPGGAVFGSGSHTTTGGYTGTIHVGPSANQSLGAAFISGGAAGSVGNWSFQAWEAYNDSGIDQRWNNLSLTVGDFVPPTPPANTDLGTYTETGRTKAYGTISVNTEIDWYKVVLSAAHEMNFSTDKTRYIEGSEDGLGPHPGPALDDSMIGVYDFTGSLLASNDDINYPANPYSLVHFASLPAGTYYVAVAGYSATFGGNFGVTHSSGTLTGDYWLNITPEPATLGLLAVGALAMIRRRR